MPVVLIYMLYVEHKMYGRLLTHDFINLETFADKLGQSQSKLKKKSRETAEI